MPPLLTKQYQLRQLQNAHRWEKLAYLVDIPAEVVEVVVLQIEQSLCVLTAGQIYQRSQQVQLAHPPAHCTLNFF